MKEITAYKVGDNIYASKEEAKQAEKSLQIRGLLNSIDGHLENPYPSRAGIVKNIIVELIKNDILEKNYLFMLVDILQKIEDEDYN